MKPLFKTLLATIGISAATLLTTVSSVQAIENASTPSPDSMTTYSNSDLIYITDSVGKLHKVPLVVRFSTLTSAGSRYQYYNSKGINIFWRGDVNGQYTYQPVPSLSAYVPSGLTGKTFYWSSLYESSPSRIWTPFYNQAFWRYYWIDANTSYCGTREYGDEPLAYHCEGHKSTLHKKGLVPSSVQIVNGKATYGTLGNPRFIGYSGLGNYVFNAMFPVDYPTKATNATYPWDKHVFNTGGALQPPKTRYDTSEYYALKRNSIIRLMKQEGLSGSVDDWMDRFSLMTHPGVETGVFYGTSNNGTKYNVITIPPEETATRNVALVEAAIYDEAGKLVVKVTQNPGTNVQKVTWGKIDGKKRVLEPMESYRLDMTVKNDSTSELVSRYNYLTVISELFSGGKKEIKFGSTLGAGQTAKTSVNFVTPAIDSKDVEITAKVGVTYNTGSYTDNWDKVDDYAYLKVGTGQLPVGDLAVEDVRLVEVSTGKNTTHPIEDTKYRACYDIKYTGDSLPTVKLPIQLTAKVNFYKINSSGALTDTIKTQTLSTGNVTLQNGKTYTVCTEDFTAQSYQIGLNGEIQTKGVSVSYTNTEGKTVKETLNINKYTSNDSKGRIFKAPINVSIHNLIVQPTNHPGACTEDPFSLHFNVSVLFLSQVNTGQKHLVPVQVKIDRPGQSGLVFDEKIQVYSMSYAVPYTLTLSGKDRTTCIPENSKITVTVNPLGKTDTLAETNYRDNSETITWTATPHPVPPTTAGYCADPNRYNIKNTWQQVYTITNFANYGANQSYGYDGVKLSDYESYRIEAIEFRSKLTKDKKMGPAQDGWVNALTQPPEIRAGYGFEIRVTTVYETNAYRNELNDPLLSRIMAANRKQDIHTLLTDPVLTHTLYMKLPDGSIVATANNTQVTQHPNGLSLTGVQLGTSSKDKSTVQYTLTPRPSPNNTNHTVNEFYIDENTPDGTYHLKFYTGAVLGIPGKTPNKVYHLNPSVYKPLCDLVDVTFKVDGSVYDDLDVDVLD